MGYPQGCIVLWTRAGVMCQRRQERGGGVLGGRWEEQNVYYPGHSALLL